MKVKIQMYCFNSKNNEDDYSFITEMEQLPHKGDFIEIHYNSDKKNTNLNQYQIMSVIYHIPDKDANQDILFYKPKATILLKKD